MKRVKAMAGAMIASLLLLSGGCSSPVKLVASWTDTQATPMKFSHILVMAIGKDLSKRQLAHLAHRCLYSFMHESLSMTRFMVNIDGCP